MLKTSSSQRFHNEQLVATVVDHLHGDLAVLTGLEWRARGTGEVVPHRLLVRPLSAFLRLSHALVRGKTLDRHENRGRCSRCPGTRRHIVAARCSLSIVDWVEHIETEQLDLVRRLALHPYLADLDFRHPQTLKIWLDRMFLSRSPIIRSGVACT